MNFRTLCILSLSFFQFATAHAVQKCNTSNYQLLGQTSITVKDKKNQFQTSIKNVVINESNGLGPNSNIYEKYFIQTNESIVRLNLIYGKKNTQLKLSKISQNQFEMNNFDLLPIEQEKIQKLILQIENNKKEICNMEIPYHAAD